MTEIKQRKTRLKAETHQKAFRIACHRKFVKEIQNRNEMEAKLAEKEFPTLLAGFEVFL